MGTRMGAWGRGLAVVTALLVATAVVSACGTSDPTVAQVSETTLLAMESMQQIGSIDAVSPDPDTNTGATQPAGVYSRAERPDLRQVTAEEISAMCQIAEVRLRNYFAGDQLDHLLEVNAGFLEAYQPLTVPDGSPGSPAADTSANAAYEFTGGVDNFEVESVSINGDEADISGTATIWVNGAWIDSESTRVDRASNAVSFIAHLIREGDRWKVDSYDDTFLPGSEP